MDQHFEAFDRVRFHYFHKIYVTAAITLNAPTFHRTPAHNSFISADIQGTVIHVTHIMHFDSNLIGQLPHQGEDSVRTPCSILP